MSVRAENALLVAAALIIVFCSIFVVCGARPAALSDGVDHCEGEACIRDSSPGCSRGDAQGSWWSPRVAAVRARAVLQ